MAEHRFPGEHMYEDLVLEEPMPRYSIELIRDMPIIEGDVIISTYPKTGNSFNSDTFALYAIFMCVL